jgi:hypothetical protein
MAPRVFRTPYGELYVRTWCMSRVPILVQHVHRCVRHEECGKLHAMCTGLPKLPRDPTSRAGCSHAAAIASKGVRPASAFVRVLRRRRQKPSVNVKLCNVTAP